MNEIKRRNNEKEFVNSFAKNIGYPVWDKAIVSSNHKNPQQSGFTNVVNEDTSFVYIPLVIENDVAINGYIMTVVSDSSMNIVYRLAQDYKNYHFEETTTQLSATQFAYSMIRLNSHVFGNMEYTITDKRLFSSDTTQYHTQKITLTSQSTGDGSNGLLNENVICSEITWQGIHCGTPLYCAQRGSCDLCGTYCYMETVGGVTICYGDGTPSIPPTEGSPPTGGGTPTTGGGGGDIPHDYPCTPTPIPNVVDNPLPPCPPPTGGTGWNPNDFNINNPCNVVDSLLRSIPFRQNLKKLRDSCVLNYEKSIMFKNAFTPGTYASVMGTGQASATDTMEVTLDVSEPQDGVMHDHPKGSRIFGADDFYQLATLWREHKVQNSKTFTFSLVTDTTSYIIMITDSVKFNAFVNAWLKNLDLATKFSTLYYDTYHMDDDLPIGQKEINFFKAIQTWQAAGPGIKLFKGNADMTSFNPIKLVNGTLIKPDPCY